MAQPTTVTTLQETLAWSRKQNLISSDLDHLIHARMPQIKTGKYKLDPPYFAVKLFLIENDSSHAIQEMITLFQLNARVSSTSTTLRWRTGSVHN